MIFLQVKSEEMEEVLDSELDEATKEQLKGAKTSKIDEEHSDNNNDESSLQEHEESHKTNKGTRDFELF